MSRTVGEKPCARVTKKAKFAPMKPKWIKKSVCYTPEIECVVKKMQKNCKKCKIMLDGVATPWYDAANERRKQSMPNQRVKNKKMLRVWITMELYEKFRKVAKMSGVSMSSILTAYVVEMTKKIQLSAEDYERIAQELRNKK